MSGPFQYQTEPGASWLTIPDIQLEDAGTYQCLVQTGLEEPDTLYAEVAIPQPQTTSLKFMNVLTRRQRHKPHVLHTTTTTTEAPVITTTSLQDLFRKHLGHQHQRKERMYGDRPRNTVYNKKSSAFGSSFDTRSWEHYRTNWLLTLVSSFTSKCTWHLSHCSQYRWSICYLVQYSLFYMNVYESTFWIGVIARS